MQPISYNKLAAGYKRYLILKSNPKYIFDYRLFKLLREVFFETHPDAAKKNSKVSPLRDELEDFSLRFFEEKWQVFAPISPRLTIDEKDLLASSRRFSRGIIQLIYCFKLIEDVGEWVSLKRELPASCLSFAVKPKRSAVAQLHKEDIEKLRKFLVFSFSKNTKLSHRQLGDVFGVSKDTITNWADEVEDWPDIEKEIYLTQVATGHRPLPNKDIYELGAQKIVTYEEHTHAVPVNPLESIN